VRIALDNLVERWKGRHGTLEVAFGDQLRVYQGSVDGPYVGTDAGVGFMLGVRLISGDIAVEGPFINFDPAKGSVCPAPVLTDAYVEVRVAEVPVVVELEGREATWQVSVGHERTVRFRLVTERDGSTSA
jgi:hypothetical protein